MEEEIKKDVIETEKESTLIEKAESVALRMEEANKVTEQLLIRQEKAKIQNILSGTSEAGGVVQMSDDDKTREGMKDYFKGTALEGAIK